MANDLDALFKPRSVAVVGASANPGKIGHVVLENLTPGEFDLYPVNPHETEILGLKCYPSLGQIPADVDMAVVVLPARSSLSAVREAVAKGVGVIVVTSSGFGERGGAGRALQDSLTAAASGSGSRILGPNTMGVVVPSHRLDTFFISSERSPRPGKGSVAIISQSGAVAVSCLEKAEASGMGVSACVCLGNKADIDEVDMILHLADDPDTRCIAMYLESFSDGRRFLEAASRACLRKPIVLFKAGRTEAGLAAARSHTGAIAAGSDAVVDGALAQAGVVRVYEEEELVDVARALSTLDHIEGNRVCIVASAGGFGVIAADLVESPREGLGLRMASLGEGTAKALGAMMPEFSTAQNPVDLTAEVSDSMYDQVLGALRADEGVDSVMMSLELQPPNITSALLEVAQRHASSPGPPVVISLFARDQGSVIRDLSGRGLVAYPTIRRSMRAIAALSERGAYLRRNR